MKAKEREKEIEEHMPTIELVDGVIAFLKTVNQISNEYTLPYEHVCSALAYYRLQIYHDEGRFVSVYSDEYMFLLNMIIEMEYFFGSDDVEKEHNDFMEFYKGLSVEEKQKVDAGLIRKHRFLHYFLPVFGVDKTQEIFWVGRHMGFKDDCTATHFMNNYRYFDSDAGKYKLKCLLCDNDGLCYHLVYRSKEGSQNDFRQGLILFVCKDHYVLKPGELLEKVVPELDRISPPS